MKITKWLKNVIELEVAVVIRQTVKVSNTYRYQNTIEIDTYWYMVWYIRLKGMMGKGL